MGIINIDGVPFISDEQEDKNLLGSLFRDAYLPNTSLQSKIAPQGKLEQIHRDISGSLPNPEKSIFYEPETLTENDFNNPTFVSIDTDWELLLKSIRYNTNGSKFLLRHTDYDTSNSIRIHSESNPTIRKTIIEERSKKYIDKSEFYINTYGVFYCKINTLINYIDATNYYFGVTIYENNSIEYYLKFYYLYDKIISTPATDTESDKDVNRNEK